MSEPEQESLARIEAGHIPLAAERRLSELSERGGCFTSDLSVNGYALCDQLRLTPLSQVMGSSTYQMGYQGAWYQYQGWGPPGAGGAFMVELDTLSQALNEVRTRALGRLGEEAAQLGADAVVGVSTRASEEDLQTGSVSLQYTVLGTAVSRSNSPSARPVLTELSVADFSKLVQGGFEPLGIVAWSSVFFGGYAFGAGIATGEPMGMAMGMGMGMGMQNFELTEFTQAFYQARETVMAQLGAQAAALDASGIVGMRITHVARRRELATGVGSRERSGLMVTFNATGTAIRELGGASIGAPKPVLDLRASPERIIRQGALT